MTCNWCGKTTIMGHPIAHTPSHLRIEPATVLQDYHDICLPFMDHNHDNNHVTWNYDTLKKLFWLIVIVVAWIAKSHTWSCNLCMWATNIPPHQRGAVLVYGLWGWSLPACVLHPQYNSRYFYFHPQCRDRIHLHITWYLSHEGDTR